ncbi:Holliday junction resolvase RuvX [Candidatus Saccharibacteria bacterium]|nr:Holliday junction resolvase RuvX [Candidatus Saccharibacteria bacterium]
MSQPPSNLLGLDVGEKNIGVARVNLIAKIPEPLAVLTNNSSFSANLSKVVQEYSIDSIVVGLPRSLSGEETKQSKYVRDFVDNNLSQYQFVWQDETLSTVNAQLRMKQMGFEKQPAMLDSVAACIILEDYILTCM